MPDVKKVLFFSPFAFIWQHAVPEFQLAQVLHDQGLEVKIIGCRRSYATFCTAMESIKVSVNADQSVKDKVCTGCIRSSERLQKAFPRLPFSPIEAYAVGADAPPGAGIDIPKTPDAMLGYTVDGVDVGRLALYETLIKYKKFNMDLKPVERQSFEALFLNALKVLKQATNALRTEKPDVVVCYSPQYVIPGVFAAVAARENIPVIFVEGSSNDIERYSHLRMWDWETHGLNQPALKNLQRFESYKFTDKRAARARKLMAIRESASAFSAYTSAAKDVSPYDVFGLDRSRKYILMAMSSYDEVYSGYIINKLPLARFEGGVFRNQVDWLRETIAWFSSHPELQLVVRPHPREIANAREMTDSPHVKEWSAVLESLPANVKIDHPDQKFSLYDHFPHISALITGWSSVGVEALSKGVPVVTYDQELPTFPKSIHYTGSSRPEYFENILRASRDTDRDRHIQDATRWLAYASEIGTIEIGGRFNDRFKSLTNARQTFGEGLSRRLDLLFPPSRVDAGRILDLIQRKGSSLFDLPERAD
jgi:hypothetical protein